MSDSVHCPRCGAAFELTEVMRQHLETELRAQLQQDFQRTLDQAKGRAAAERAIVEGELEAARKRLAAGAAKEAELLRKDREVEARAQQVELDLERRLGEERAKIREAAERAASERFGRQTAEQVQAKQQELDDAKRRLTEAASKEAEHLRKAREFEDRERSREVELERRLGEEARRIREQATKDVEARIALEQEKQQLREEEQRLKSEALQRTIDELQRKALQGSQQVQGEAQEVRLRDVLLEAFPHDVIEDVAKGARGADLLQRVRSAEGKDSGTLIWESKRTKAFTADWLAKLRDDQRQAGAACAVIVTEALPAEVRHFAVIDEVWVCAWPYAKALAAVLRSGLIEVAAARQSAEGRGEKMQMLYAYLTGTEFRNRVGGLVEAFTEMQQGLDDEKRAMSTLWKRRDRQLQRARENITAFYGDLQGIAGRQLDDIPQLALAPGPGQVEGEEG